MKMRNIEEVATVLALGLTSVEEIESGLADMNREGRCSARLTAAMVVLVEMTKRTAEEMGKHPRDVLDKVIEVTLANLPERPPQDLPTRVSKTKGPSPWGL